MVEHAGERPYKCTYCNKAFSHVIIKKHLWFWLVRKQTNIEVLSDSHIKDPSLKFNLIFHSEESIYIYMHSLLQCILQWLSMGENIKNCIATCLSHKIALFWCLKAK